MSMDTWNLGNSITLTIGLDIYSILFYYLYFILLTSEMQYNDCGFLYKGL